MISLLFSFILSIPLVRITTRHQCLSPSVWSSGRSVYGSRQYYQRYGCLGMQCSSSCHGWQRFLLDLKVKFKFQICQDTGVLFWSQFDTSYDEEKLWNWVAQRYRMASKGDMAGDWHACIWLGFAIIIIIHWSRLLCVCKLASQEVTKPIGGWPTLGNCGIYIEKITAEN